MDRRARALRWLAIIGVAGFQWAFVLRCDKAALNFQRAFFQGLGEDTADIVLAQTNLNAAPDDADGE